MLHEAAGPEEPRAELLRMMRGYWVSEAIFVAAQLGIADALAGGPLGAATLAAKTAMPERTLFRLLRALASVGILDHQTDGTFSLTVLGAPLRSDVPGSLRASGIVMGRIFVRAWAELMPSLQAGRPVFERVFGADLFRYLAARPDLSARFQEMMSDLNPVPAETLPTDYDFGTTGKVVDVGGGNGSLLQSVLEAHPGLTGVLFDQPHVLDEARRRLAEAGLADRCQCIPGNFMSQVPSGGNVYLLRWILHDYDDAQAAKLLRACRAAMPDDGRLVVIEQVLPEIATPDMWIPAFQDLQMLLLLGGQERTEAEFRALFSEAGFTLSRVLATRSPFAALEGVPV